MPNRMARRCSGRPSASEVALLAGSQDEPTLVGTRLWRARVRLGLSRSHVARLAEIDAAQLYRLENRHNVKPTFEIIVRLSRVLGISLDSLASPP